MTITEGLAEIKTLVKRIEKKKLFILANLAHASTMHDPLTKDGGSDSIVEKELQAIKDMENRLVSIRIWIAQANAATAITLNGQTKTIAEWLIWKREVAPGRSNLLAQMTIGLASMRKQIEDKGREVADKGLDLIPHVSEVGLAQWNEEHETILSELDGQLSLRNATVQIEVPVSSA